MYKKEENNRQENRKIKETAPSTLAKPPDAAREALAHAALGQTENARELSVEPASLARTGLEAGGEAKALGPRSPEAAESARRLRAQMRVLALHIQSTEEALDCYAQAVQRAENSADSPADATKKSACLPGGAAGARFGLIRRAGRPRRYRALRRVISGAARGLRQGLQSLYNFSQAAGGGYSRAVDSAAALQALKGSLAVALAPILTGLLPLLTAAASAAANAAASIANFFSAAGMHAGAGEGYHREVCTEALQKPGNLAPSAESPLFRRAANRPPTGPLRRAAALLKKWMK